VTFLGLIVKNLLRQRVRSILTIVGIAIAIVTVVALGVITTGMKATASAFVTSGSADFMVAQKGAADLSFSTLPESTVDEVRSVDGVAQARGSYMFITKAGSNPFFFLGGVEPDTIATEVDLIEGSSLTGTDPDEILLGSRGASDLGVTIGDAVTVSDHTFHVVGIYRSDVLWEDSGGFAPLETIQEVAGKPDTVTIAYVTVSPGADKSAVADEVTAQVPGVVTISSANDYSQVDQGFVLLDAATVAISLLAVLIGGIGVMNTMIMSVFERTREIGVLRAVGWSGQRVLRMIVLESLVLTIVAAAIGCLVGVAVSNLVILAPAVKDFIQPAYAGGTFVLAFIIAVIVGLLGALYPAIRAARLTPMEALRYE
jgi:putative ABC transport system permease protein